MAVAVGYLWYVRHRASALIGLTIGLPLLIAIFWQPLWALLLWTGESYLDHPDEAARTTMSLDSLVVALNFFPLGAGFGRFGS